MKQILITTLILSLFSCKESAVDSNTERTIKWIESHKKPIQVKTFIYDKENRNYTLFSADNKICATGTVVLELPLLITDSVKVPDNIVIVDDYSDFRNQLKDLQDMKSNTIRIREIISK